MSTQTTKTAKRPTKAAARTAKKPTKATKDTRSVAKTARGTDKKAAKSARSPVGKAAETARTLMAAARSSKVAIKPNPAPKMIASPPVQPAASEMVLKSHKYHVGEIVYFTSPTFGRAAASGTYTVVKLLPSESDDYQYRIKSSGEAFERVAKESQLDKM